MSDWRVIDGDCVEQMAAMEEASVDACVTDPPYGLSAEPDIAEVLTHWLAGDDYKHRGGGFMGRTWDSFVPGPAYWREVYRVLKPGGWLLAFAGTRTVDLMGIAIRLAGFERRDLIAYMYGSGFPKSLDVGKAIDAAAGATREVVGPSASNGRAMQPGRSTFVGHPDPRYGDAPPLTAPATPDAERWQGWGTALKPSHEPVLVAQKPRTERDTLAEIGSWLDRLETWLAQASDPTTPTGAAGDSSAQTGTSPCESTAPTFSSTVTSWRKCWAELWTAANTSTTSTATKPTTDLATLCCSLSAITRESTTPDPTRADGWKSLAEAADSLFAAAVLSSRATRALSAAETATGRTLTSSPAEAAPLEPERSPIVVARKPLAGNVAQNVLAHGTGALNVDGCRIGEPAPSFATGGTRRSGGIMGASEPLGGWENTASGRWPANVVLDESSAAMLDAQTGESVSRSGGVTTNALGRMNDDGWQAQTLARTGHDDSGGASRFFYTPKASTAERNALDLALMPRARSPRKRSQQDAARRWAPRARNRHPTVKPVELMRWLVRLVTPPGGTVLDPFAGSGTTGCAAVLEGFRFLGIEREDEYAAIACARIAWWADHPDGMELVDRLEHEKQRKAVVDSGQLGLFG